MGKEYSYYKDSIWRDYLVPESRSHGARYNLHLYLDLVEEYSRPGDVILDPFGGVGSCLAGAVLGRTVVMVEVESWIHEIALRNKEKLRGLGAEEEKMIVLCGDSRIMLPLPCGIIITSPPYSDVMKKPDKSEKEWVDKYFGSTTAQGYGESEAQLGNKPWGMQRFELKKIWRGCYDSLPPGGRMITITKDSIKNKKRVEVGSGTVLACLDIGFELEEHRKANRRMTALQASHTKDPDYHPILFEDVNIFFRGSSKGG